MSKMPEPPVTEIVMLREAVQGMTLRCLKAEARVAELEAENEELRDVMENLGIREGSAEARAALAKQEGE